MTAIPITGIQALCGPSGPASSTDDPARQSGVDMELHCHRRLNGRFVVESTAGDTFEFQMVVRNHRQIIRRLGPPRWRPGPWPSDADAITAAARRVATERAKADGNLGHRG